MSAQTCVECGLTFDLSKFVPRLNVQYEDLPTMDEVWRQPRCRDCNRIYGRRRSLFLGRIAALAEQHGVYLRARPHSVYRVVEVEDSDRGRRALGAVQQVVRAFNGSLPDDRCDVGRHGITVISVPIAAAKQTVLPLDGPPSP